MEPVINRWILLIADGFSKIDSIGLARALLCLALLPNRAAAQSLIFNPTFQFGLTNWAPRGAGSLQIVTNCYLAPNAVLVTNRTDPDDGVAQAPDGKLVPASSNRFYRFLLSRQPASGFVDGIGR